MNTTTRQPRDYLLSVPGASGEFEPLSSSRISSKLVVTVADRGVLLGRLAGRGEWVLPGGGIHELADGSMEQPLDALHRELSEEGYSLDTRGRQLGELLVARFVIGRERDKVDEHGRRIGAFLKLCHVVNAAEISLSHRYEPGSEISEARIFDYREVAEVIHPDEAALGDVLMEAARTQQYHPRHVHVAMAAGDIRSFETDQMPPVLAA